MTVEQIQTALASSGIPCAYRYFPQGEDVQTPFMVWYMDGENYVYADNKNYLGVKDITIELYTTTKNAQTEAAVEEAVAKVGAFSKVETYIDSDDCYLIRYETEVI